ncbi:hypothetical protein N0V90_003761 [Kalmusia sp. IMI 367209]|nr:hypothetical protein N0V90_003761 [Kalmusia sp. IMI 367209]
MSMDYAMQNAWDIKGTSPEKHEEVIEARRKQLRENPGLAEKELEEYRRWYKEERAPTWQERLINKVKGKKHQKGESDGSDEEKESLEAVKAETVKNEGR